MKICTHCQQHIISAHCPHCSASTRSNGKTLAVLLGLGTIACDNFKEQQYEPAYGVAMIDADSDGFMADYEDCDDNDPTTFPGSAIEDSETACMQDFDGDGFGNATPDNEYIEAGTDCDDDDPAINPAEGNCP